MRLYVALLSCVYGNPTSAYSGTNVTTDGSYDPCKHLMPPYSRNGRDLDGRQLRVHDQLTPSHFSLIPTNYMQDSEDEPQPPEELNYRECRLNLYCTVDSRKYECCYQDYQEYKTEIVDALRMQRDFVCNSDRVVSKGRSKTCGQDNYYQTCCLVGGATPPSCASAVNVRFEQDSLVPIPVPIPTPPYDDILYNMYDWTVRKSANGPFEPMVWYPDSGPADPYEDLPYCRVDEQVNPCCTDDVKQYEGSFNDPSFSCQNSDPFNGYDGNGTMFFGNATEILTKVGNDITRIVLIGASVFVVTCCGICCGIYFCCSGWAKCCSSMNRERGGQKQTVVVQQAAPTPQPPQMQPQVTNVVVNAAPQAIPAQPMNQQNFAPKF